MESAEGAFPIVGNEDDLRGMPARRLVLDRIQTGLDYTDEPHGYLWQGEPVPYLTGVLADLGLTPDLSRVDPDKLKAKAAIGKACHLAVKYLVSGILDESTVDSRVKPYLAAFKHFLVDSGFEPLACELSTYNAVLGMACTIDLVGMLNGSRVLVEMKTTATLSDSVEYQLWGQFLNWKECFPAEPILKLLSLHLKPTGKYSLDDWSDRSPDNFRHLMFTWKEKRARGGVTHV